MTFSTDFIAQIDAASPNPPPSAGECPGNGNGAGFPSPRGRGEAFTPLVGGEGSPQGEGEGVFPEESLPGPPPHPRSGYACAHFIDDKVDEVLSPPAGRGVCGDLPFPDRSTPRFPPARE